jgi:hypothetical protein
MRALTNYYSSRIVVPGHNWVSPDSASLLLAFLLSELVDQPKSIIQNT